MHVDDGHRQKPIEISATILSKWPPGSHFGFLGFQTLTLVWLWISTPNFSGIILIYMGRSLLTFSNVNFKMAAWRPYWIFWFPDSNLTLALNVNSKRQWQSMYIYIHIYIYIWVGAYWFSAALISKWPPGSNIGSFWFPDSNFSLALNMNSKLQCPNTSVYK